MIQINIPNNNIEEREYIVDILIGEFLGIEYSVNTRNSLENWELTLENGNKLIFEDAFFNYHKKDLYYLEKNIPKSIKFIKSDFIIEDNIPIIYGTSKEEVSKNKICSGIDIFASSFFMLTRWEEYANKKRDLHDRFAAIDSLAFKFEFLDRPVVNEYVEMLKKYVIEAGIYAKIQRKKLSVIFNT